MDVKWFFVIVGIFFTFAILSGIYFISLYMSLQERHHFEQTQKNANDRYNNSAMVHDSLYHNITDLKKSLDPIIAQIPNATQSELDRQLHFNQTSSNFEEIHQILDIKLQDHITVGQINQTVNELAAGKNVSTTTTNNTTTTEVCGNVPVPIENITGKEDNLLNKLPQQC